MFFLHRALLLIRILPLIFSADSTKTFWFFWRINYLEGVEEK